MLPLAPNGQGVIWTSGLTLGRAGFMLDACPPFRQFEYTPAHGQPGSLYVVRALGADEAYH